MRIFEKQQIPKTKQKWQNTSRDLMALEARGEGRALWLKGQRRIKKDSPHLESDVWAGFQRQRMTRGIPGGKKNKTEQNYVWSSVSLGSSVCRLVWKEARTDEQQGLRRTDRQAGARAQRAGTRTECLVSQTHPRPGRPRLTSACGGPRERHTVLGQSAPARSTTLLHNNPERNFTQNKSLVNDFSLKKGLPNSHS